MDVRKIRSLQYVRRFNYERCNRYQSVAEHSAMVAVLAYEAANVLGWPQPAAYEAAFFALMHDAEEAVTGDILHLTKRALRKRGDGVAWLERQAANELELNAPVPTSRERILELVEYCDVLELALYLQEEEASGSRTVDGILRETYGRLAANMFYSWLKGWTEKLLGFSGDPDFVSLSDLASPEPEFLKH
jgi:5'-deoxynucleotidase YfbR-like HD superfamily hydrolase